MGVEHHIIPYCIKCYKKFGWIDRCDCPWKKVERERREEERRRREEEERRRREEEEERRREEERRKTE